MKLIKTAPLRAFSAQSSKLLGGVEKTVFEHNLSATATHGAITQQWHAGKPSGVTPNLRVRMYIDGESVRDSLSQRLCRRPENARPSRGAAQLE